MDFEIDVYFSEWNFSEWNLGWTKEKQISEFWKRWKKGKEKVFIAEERTLKDIGYTSHIFKLRGKDKFVCIPVFNSSYFYEGSYVNISMTAANFPEWWTAVLKVRDNILMAYR